MAHADWIIDMGPGAGEDGGRLVFSGPPSELLTSEASVTARHLRSYTGVSEGSPSSFRSQRGSPVSACAILGRGRCDPVSLLCARRHAAPSPH